MGLAETIYSPLKEASEIESPSWDKETIEYVMANKNKVTAHIKRIAAAMTKRSFQKIDAEDVLSELFLYLYKYSDYDVVTAIERAKNGSPANMERYILSCAKFCVRRHITESYNREKEHIRDTQIVLSEKEGNTVSILDTVEDRGATADYDQILLDLDECCRQYEGARYKYGSDFYLMLFLRMLTMGKPEEAYDSLLEVLDISKKELANTMKKMREEEAMVNIAKAINTISAERAISILGKYVFSANRIRQIAERI